MGLDTLCIEDFEKCLNQSWRIHVDGAEPLETELIQVSSLVPADDDPDRRPPFSLIFRGPADAVLAQGIFTFENETLGKLDLFVVTIGPDDTGLRHEVVFT